MTLWTGQPGSAFAIDDHTRCPTKRGLSVTQSAGVQNKVLRNLLRDLHFCVICKSDIISGAKVPALRDAEMSHA